MTRKEIGAVLVRTRKAQKLSAYHVCKEAKVTNQQLTGMEKGLTNYTVESLRAVCEVLGLEVNVDVSL